MERKTKAKVVGLHHFLNFNIASGITTCQRENCQRRTRKTGIDVGVSQDTSYVYIKVGKYEEEEYTTKIEEFYPRIASTTIQLISKPILLSIFSLY